MAEMPETPGRLDPDLDEPGEPIHATLELEDGTRKPYDIPQTKRDNCIAVAARAGGEQYVRARWSRRILTSRGATSTTGSSRCSSTRRGETSTASSVLGQVQPARDVPRPTRPPASEERRQLVPLAAQTLS